MFRLRQPLVRAPFGSSVEEVSTTNEETGVSILSVRSTVKTLPPMENTRLSALVKAGVPLEEVNTKILRGASLSVPPAEENKTTENENNSSEVNDEE